MAASDADTDMDSEMTQHLDARLTRIEDKLDTLADAMAQIARVEERLSQQSGSMDHLVRRVDDHDQRLSEVERKVTRSGVVVGWGERLFWVLVVGAVTVGGRFLVGV